MTVCAFGTRVKPSVLDDELYIAASSLLAAVTAWNPWLARLESLIMPQLVDLPALCSTTPPALPTIDLEAMILSGELYRLPNTLLDWLLAAWAQANWNTYCECTPGPSACSFTYHNSASAGLGALVNIQDVEPLPAGTTGVQGTFQTTQGSGTFQPRFRWKKPDGTYHIAIAGGAYAAPGGTWTFNQDITGGLGFTPIGIRWELYHSAGSGTLTATGDVSVTYKNCTATVPTDPYVAPAAPAAPDLPEPPAVPTGCTTDDLCLRIDTIAKALASIGETVTLIQRQKVPFATVHGAVHTGLSGTGQFSVSGILGLSVDITAAPASLGIWPGTPATRFRYGWLNLGTADGWTHGYELLHDPELVHGIDPDITLVGYTLESGVTVTITEILREP